MRKSFTLLFVTMLALTAPTALAGNKPQHEIATNDGPMVVTRKTIDASGGGIDQQVVVATVPARSVVLDVLLYVTEPWNGDFTDKLYIGVAGENNFYYDDSLTYSSVGVTWSVLLQESPAVVPHVVAVSTPIIATWTNSANATTGEVEVYVIYALLP